MLSFWVAATLFQIFVSGGIIMVALGLFVTGYYKQLGENVAIFEVLKVLEMSLYLHNKKLRQEIKGI